MKKLMSVVLLAGLVSCSQITVSSRVKSESIGDIRGKSYIIKPFKKENEGTIKFVKYSKSLKNVLNEHKMVQKEANPDLIAFLGYSIKGRQEIYTYTTYDTSTIRTRTYSPYTGNTYISTGTITTPKVNIGTKTVYDRHIIVSFADNKSKKTKIISDLIISSNGSSSDLSAVFPFMMKSALPFVGTNRSGTVEIVYDYKKKKVVKVRSAGLSDIEKDWIMNELNQDLLDITG